MSQVFWDVTDFLSLSLVFVADDCHRFFVIVTGFVAPWFHRFLPQFAVFVAPWFHRFLPQFGNVRSSVVSQVSLTVLVIFVAPWFHVLVTRYQLNHSGTGFCNY